MKVTGGLAGEVLRRMAGMPELGMPLGTAASRAVIASHIARKALRTTVLRQRSISGTFRELVAEAIFFELAHRSFGPNSMIRGEHGFYPHIFMPEYHGPCFDEALRRLVLPERGPNILYFSLTGLCPCNCEYCFAQAGGTTRHDIGDSFILEVARQVAALRVPLVNLTGGEPLMQYPRLLRTIRVLRSGSEVRMFTSGFGLTADRLEALREAGLQGVFVSLDTDDAGAFDRARGKPGAFAAAVAALRLCAGAGMLTFINCVVSSKRFFRRDEIARFLRFVEDIDPRIVVNFLPQLATGRGARSDSFGRPEECAEVGSRLVSTALAMHRPITMLFGTVDHFIGCPGAGGKLMNIDIEGNVTVCISRASMGNLLEEPFSDIYARFAAQCRELKVGFFCCEVSRAAGGDMLEQASTRHALRRFYHQFEDAEWQQIISRYDWLFSRLL